MECWLLSRCPQNLRPVFVPPSQTNNVENEKFEEEEEKSAKTGENKGEELDGGKISEACPSMGVILPLRLALIAQKDPRLDLLMDHRFGSSHSTFPSCDAHVL